MNNSKLSSIDVLKILACVVFDIALLLIYFKVFGLFLIIAPAKSILILLILLIGIVMLNVVFIFSSKIYKTIGMAYAVAFIFLTVLYVIISNVLSIFLIPSNIVWYTFWELIILAVFLGIVSVIAAFSKDSIKYEAKAKKEQQDRTSIMTELLEIENILVSKESEEDILVCSESFRALKERIQASTPFGRINGNNEVLKMEKQIKNNLESFKVGFQGDLSEKKLAQLQRLLEDTRRMVINRETLNIQ